MDGWTAGATLPSPAAELGPKSGHACKIPLDSVPGQGSGCAKFPYRYRRTPNLKFSRYPPCLPCAFHSLAKLPGLAAKKTNIPSIHPMWPLHAVPATSIHTSSLSTTRGNLPTPPMRPLRQLGDDLPAVVKKSKAGHVRPCARPRPPRPFLFSSAHVAWPGLAWPSESPFTRLHGNGTVSSSSSPLPPRPPRH